MVKSTCISSEKAAKAADKKPSAPISQHSTRQQDVSPLQNLQRGILPANLRPADILQLQRTVGNRAVGALLGRNSPSRLPIQAKLVIGQPADQYEQEADRIAAQVVEQINAPTSGKPTQEQPEQPQALSGKNLQTKPVLQLREAIQGREASTHLETAINQAKGCGQPLDKGLEQSMGQAMGADFSGVRVHTDAQADQLNQSIQAKALTTGQDVFFRQGAYEPRSRSGQVLIAHELTHVVQQNSNNVHQGLHDGNQNIAVHPQAAHRNIIQRATYAELSDSQKEMVDQVSNEKFDKVSKEFEQNLGLMAAGDKRATESANKLLERSKKLVNQLFNEATDAKFTALKAKGDKGLNEFYEETYGLENRKDISGGIGKNIEMIYEVIESGSFREKMSLYYVALAENRTINKILNQYSKLLDEEFKKSGVSVQPNAAVIWDQKLKDKGVDNYLFVKNQKEYLKRAMTWIQMEIQLERRYQMEMDNQPTKEHLTAEAAQQRKEQDELLAIQIIDKISGGKLEGDETTDPKKTEAIRLEVEESMFAMKYGYAQPDPNSLGSIADLERILLKDKNEVIKTLKKSEENYKEKSLGWYLMQMDRIFANEEPSLEEIVSKTAGKKDVEPDSLKAAIRREVADMAVANYGKHYDPVHKQNNVDFDKVLQDFLKNITDPTQLNALAQKVKKSTDKESREGQNLEVFVDKIAAKRFSMNFMGPSLFDTKKEVDASRKGDARKMNPEKEQVSDQTPKDLENTPLRLTYRELGNAFYTPQEFSNKLTKFKQDKNITGKAQWDKAAQEEFRQILYNEKQDEKLPWKPGMKYWRIEIKSPLAEASKSLKVLVGAAVSGSTDRVMRGARYLGFKESREMDELLIACLGWMLPMRDHTYYEIMKAAEPYLGKAKAPRKNPFPDIIIDPDYAMGHGYTKMSAYFPSLKKEDFPDYFLSENYKNEIAEKMEAPQKDSQDTTLRVTSTAENKVVMTGEEVHYKVRNPKNENMNFEWYWLRHESENARAKVGTKNGDWKHKWNYKGLYKLYCLVYPKTGEHQNEPVATLRYDQIVFSKTTPEATKPEGIKARAAFTTWSEEMSEIPVQVTFESKNNLITCKLKVPGQLNGHDCNDEYEGTSQQVVKLPGPGEAIQLYNKFFRKDKDVRELQAEACYKAAQAWEKGQKYDTESGSVNVDIFDSESDVVLKEHYFYVDREGAKVTDPNATISGYRTQGGDFKSGIKSSVRLVNSFDGNLVISGDAMVWINFGDKARMVWWLNNRSDRSYTAFFQVKADYLKNVVKASIPESEANTQANKDQGKPIISQDKAAHQYAISRSTVANSSSGLEELQKQAVGKMVKMFQWTTFDITSSGDLGEIPAGKGQLAHPFNEDLKKAKDLEIKIRFLKCADPPVAADEIKKLTQEKDEKEKAGREQWSKDYRLNLRKPGKGDVSKGKDRRQSSELTDDELLSKKDDLINKLIPFIKPNLGPMLIIATKEFKKVGANKENVAKELVDSALIVFGKMNELAELPKRIRQQIYCETINGLIRDYLSKQNFNEDEINRALAESTNVRFTS